jgi:hypothetical protein
MKPTLGKLNNKLQMTSRRVAIEYIDWLQSGRVVKEPSPLNSLVKKMRADIQARFKKRVLEKQSVAEEDRALIAADQELLRLCLLYATSAHSLFTEMSQLLYFTALAKACKQDNSDDFSILDLPRLFIAQYDLVQRKIAMVDKIERDCFGVRMLPKVIRDGFSFIQSDLEITLKLRNVTLSTADAASIPAAALF